MMNRFRYLLVALVTLAVGSQIALAQLPAEQGRDRNRPALVGSVESVGGRFRLNLTNADSTREFRGTARISLGTFDQQAEAANFEFSLAPQESRLFPLDSLGIAGDYYTLVIYDQTGSPILLENAPVKRVTDTAPIVTRPATTAPVPAPANPPGAKGVTVTARLAEERPSQPQRSEVEASMPEETGPAVLFFEVNAPAPIIDANLSISTKKFTERKAVTVQGSASLEFKLPEDFNEQKINYALTNSSGRVLARGEVKLEDLKKEDSVSFNDVKLDQPSYAPGESAHLVVTLEGRSPYGYRLEVTAKDGNEATLIRESRKGVYNDGLSIQEFRVDIPPDAKGTVAFEFKAFGNLTRKLFDSGERSVVITEPSNKTEASDQVRVEGEARPVDPVIRKTPTINEPSPAAIKNPAATKRSRHKRIGAVRGSVSDLSSM